MATKVCKHCRCIMKTVILGVHRCSKCGLMWMKDRGYFTEEPDMEYYLAEATVQGITVFIPKARKKDEQENADAENLTLFVPTERKSRLIYGGIYYVENTESKGQEIRGSRPAIIISSPEELGARNVVTVVYITKRDYPPAPTRVRITSTGKVATALIEQLTNVDVSRIGDFMGMASVAEMSRIKKALITHLRLNSVVPEEIRKDDYVRQMEADVAALKKQIERM